jgi:propanediol dehydratase large subunit
VVVDQAFERTITATLSPRVLVAAQSTSEADASTTASTESDDARQLMQHTHEYIFEQLRSGVSRTDIASALTEGGWDQNTAETIIDDALQTLSEVQAKASSGLLGTLVNVLSGQLAGRSLRRVPV